MRYTKKGDKMKIYISLPITGLDIEQVKRNCILAKEAIEKKGHIAVSPLDQDTTQDFPTIFGNDIRMLLECDAVLFLDGWRFSKGCKVERYTAETYQKRLFYNAESIPDTPELWHTIGEEEMNENFNL